MANVHTQVLGGRAGAHKGVKVLSITVPNLAAAADQNIFVADQGYQLVSVREAHAVASDAGTTHLLTVRTCTGVETPAEGAIAVANNIDLKAAINTVVDPVLHATLLSTQLAAGDRLALRFTQSGGAATVLGGIAITIVLVPLDAEKGDTGDRRYWLSDV